MRVLGHQNPVLLAIWGILLVTTLVAMGFGRWSLGFVALVTLALSITPAALASRYSVNVPVPFLMGTTLFIVGSVFAGEAFDFYERLWWWDIALHGTSAVGLGLFGFLFVFMLFEGDRFAAPPAAIAFLSFCFAMAIGVLWEVFEYGMDQGFGFNMQKSGLHDTMSDLIVDAFGAAVGAVSGYFYLRGRNRHLFAPLIRQFVDANRRFYQRARDRMRR